ncbi:MAG: DinB family protein [Anaerolineales bacterium]|nr:DinB family protein [Anaerolineales bacterium]
MSRIPAIKEALAASRHRLNAVFDQVGDRWDEQVYSEGAAWNVKQLATHLAVSERGLAGQVIGIAEGREVIPADFDLERFNRRSVDKRVEMTIEQIREELAKARQELLAWVDSITDESILDNEGRHASMNIMSSEAILYQIADHERAHADDIAKALGL